MQNTYLSDNGKYYNSAVQELSKCAYLVHVILFALQFVVVCNYCMQMLESYISVTHSS